MGVKVAYEKFKETSRLKPQKVCDVRQLTGGQDGSGLVVQERAGACSSRMQAGLTGPPRSVGSRRE